MLVSAARRSNLAVPQGGGHGEEDGNGSGRLVGSQTFLSAAAGCMQARKRETFRFSSLYIQHVWAGTGKVECALFARLESGGGVRIGLRGEPGTQEGEVYRLGRTARRFYGTALQ